MKEVEYITNMAELVDFLDMDRAEVEELLRKHPISENNHFKMTPMEIADWFEDAMKQEAIDPDESVRKALRPPGEHEKHETLTFEEICAAEKVWESSSDLRQRFDDLNTFLNHIARQAQGRAVEPPVLSKIQGR